MVLINYSHSVWLFFFISPSYVFENVLIYVNADIHDGIGRIVKINEPVMSISTTIKHHIVQREYSNITQLG